MILALKLLWHDRPMTAYVYIILQFVVAKVTKQYYGVFVHVVL